MDIMLRYSTFSAPSCTEPFNTERSQDTTMAVTTFDTSDDRHQTRLHDAFFIMGKRNPWDLISISVLPSRDSCCVLHLQLALVSICPFPLLGKTLHRTALWGFLLFCLRSNFCFFFACIPCFDGLYACLALMVFPGSRLLRI